MLLALLFGYMFFKRDFQSSYTRLAYLMLLCALFLRTVTCFIIASYRSGDFESELSFALYQVIFFELPFYFLVWISYILSFGWLAIK